MNAHLTNDEFLSEFENHQGLIPIEIDLSIRKITWMDLEKYHCYEGFFHKSLDTFITLKSLQGITPTFFTTNLNTLEDERILKDYINPTGFIFHAGRCGSTLLAKVLSASRQNLVLSEAESLNQILVYRDEYKAILKNLILSMGRKRIATHEHYFIKFTSFNILFFDLIKSVFPDVPSIFIYREPMRILSSFGKNPAGWLNLADKNLKEKITGISAKEYNSLNQTEYAVKVLINFFTNALNTKANSLKYLNYDHLTIQNLPRILDTFNVNFSDDQMLKMQSQFKLDSKVEHRTQAFISEGTDEELNQQEIDNSLKVQLSDSYQELVNSDLNVI